MPRPSGLAEEQGEAADPVREADRPGQLDELLGVERLANLCAGECYQPGDERRRITHVELVRIRPQVRPTRTSPG